MKKKSHNGALKVGLGMAAVSALALGAYYLSEKDGAKNRKKVKAWMLKAKAEVLEQVENAKEISLDAYNEAVEKVAAKYKKMEGINPLDIAAFVSELKSSGKAATGGMKKKAKGVVKKVTAKMKPKAKAIKNKVKKLKK